MYAGRIDRYPAVLGGREVKTARASLVWLVYSHSLKVDVALLNATVAHFRAVRLSARRQHESEGEKNDTSRDAGEASVPTALLTIQVAWFCGRVEHLREHSHDELTSAFTVDPTHKC